MADTLLSSDAFNNEQSQKLFEVIDELHSCGAKAYIDLPEVIRMCLTSKPRELMYIDCHRRRSIIRKIFPAPELDRHSFSRSRAALYKISD